MILTLFPTHLAFSCPKSTIQRRRSCVFLLIFDTVFPFSRVFIIGESFLGSDKGDGYDFGTL